MTPLIIVLLALLPQSTPSGPVKRPDVTSAPAPVAALDAEVTEKLLKAKRVYVESFGDDSINKALQAMVIDALRSSKRFIVTENRDKADLVMKGSALEMTSQEFHALGASTQVAQAAGSKTSNVSGTAVGRTATVTGSSSAGFVARAVGIDDAQASTETINEARLAVRLVASDGDVVWSTTQESKGAKYKGASADVAEKIVKQLLHDVEKLGKAQ